MASRWKPNDPPPINQHGAPLQRQGWSGVLLLCPSTPFQRKEPKGKPMKNISITIQGVTPMLMHAFTDEAQLAATSGTRTSSANADRGTAREQAEAHLYKSSDGESIIIPQPNIFSCIVAAGKFFKNGKSKITTMKTSLIPACVFFNDTEYPLTHNDWSVDTRAVRIPSTGGRIQRHRPIFEEWSLTFSVDLDTTEISERLFREIVDAAGNKIGLGDFRPETKGPFGRFKVTQWTSQDAESALLAAE